MNDEVFPRLKELFETQELYHETLMTQGIGESYLAQEIEEWEDAVRADGLSLAYLPSPGIVKLRLSSKNGRIDSDKINTYFEEVLKRIPKHAYSIGEKSISEVLGQLLIDKNMTIGSVESCSGGTIAKELVKIAGSSRYYEGSIVAYSYKEKENLLGISHDDLIKHGAVSEEIIAQMAEKGRKLLDVDVCVSTSGIAGPDGGLPNKPVGTVWIAVSTEKRVFKICLNFGDNRERNISMTALSALNLVRCEILGLNS